MTPVFELIKNKLYGCSDNQVTISGCPFKFFFLLSVHDIHMYKGEFWLQIYGCPSDNCINIFGRPVTFLVVPGAWTTKILNAVPRTLQFSLPFIINSTTPILEEPSTTTISTQIQYT